MDVLWLIWEMRDKRKRKPAKKVEVLNRAAYIGMGRERTEQAINELCQMGKIMELKGKEADSDMLRVVDEKPFYKYRLWQVAYDLRNPEG